MRLSVKYLDKNYEFEEVCPGIWKLLTDWQLDEFMVPSGFLTDFRTGYDFWFIPKYSMCYVLHDFLYQKGLMSRKKSDKKQDEIAKKDPNFSFAQRKTVYLAVRIFGKKYWNYYRNGGEFPYQNP